VGEALRNWFASVNTVVVVDPKMVEWGMVTFEQPWVIRVEHRVSRYPHPPWITRLAST
jgi:hypothetical protein